MAKGGILPMAEIGILYLTIYSKFHAILAERAELESDTEITVRSA